jgi:hypothetical protein
MPAYPKDMRKTAKQIRDLGMVPGLTVDPLPTSGGSKEWTGTSGDGTTWVNLSHAEGRKHAVERMQKVVGWEFEFFVVQPSAIPDEVLKQFNMTRAQADGLALEVMVEAAGGKPALPSASCTLKAEWEPWLEAAASSGRMAEFGLIPGPVRLDVTAVSSLDDHLLAAMTLFQGPIEFVGKPKPEVEKQLGDLLSRPRLFGRPSDVAQSSPKLWQLPLHNREDGAYLGDSVVMFPGAGAWTPADLTRDAEGDAYVWRAADGELVDPAKGPVPASQRFAVYGVTPKSPRPALMGASAGLGLLLDDVRSLSWNETTGMLSGVFEGNNRERATAYVSLPEGWSFKSGKAGDASISKKDVGGLIRFPVANGVATRFDLEFTKKGG